jgi:uncharacterized protein YndB with AHSA1/START domain
MWRTSYGGHSVGETPGPIPNPEAKTHSADGTAFDRMWESRTPPDNTNEVEAPHNVWGLPCLTGYSARAPGYAWKMSNIFSHAPQPHQADSERPEPRQASVVVPVNNADAFDGFTDGIHLWWPMDPYSGFGPEAHVGFEGQQLVEESDAGEHQLWGEVQAWEEPTSLVMRWHLGDNSLTPTQVRVDFADDGNGATVLTLTQDGWAPGQAGRAQFEKYCDWPLILSRYARFMGGRV